MNLIENPELIEKLKGRDEQAFEKVVEAYKNKLYNFSFSLLGNLHDAEEIAIDALFKFHNELPRFRGECSISTYLFRITRNLCIDFLRKNNKKEHIPINEVSAYIEAGSDTLSEVINREEIKGVYKALAQISSEFREIMILREFNELSYEEIAGVLNISLANVKIRLKRAREKVASLIKNGR